MIHYHADWILPITAPPIRRGVVTVQAGRVVAAGSSPTADSATTHDLGRAVILPSLVNAHTHLELSALAGRVAPAPSMPEWVRSLIEIRGRSSDQDPAAIRAAIGAVRSSGTGLVGDIGNTLAAVPELRSSPLRARVFREVVGFPDVLADQVVTAAVEEIAAVGGTDAVRVGLAAHAPYSVGREAFRALGRASQALGGPRAVHLGESSEEVEFLSTGRGPWRDLLERIGRWDPAWEAPGAGPVAHLDQLGWLGDDLVVAHGVQLRDDELSRLASAGATLVTCPRSNRWTGVGDPPVDRFVRSGVRLAVGTDSLASAPDLNLFAELARLRELSSDVPACTLLTAATAHGARALGFGGELGEIAPGALASLIAVPVPDESLDVEEYLVRGVGPDQVTWLDPDDGAAG